MSTNYSRGRCSLKFFMTSDFTVFPYFELLGDRSGDEDTGRRPQIYYNNPQLIKNTHLYSLIRIYILANSFVYVTKRDLDECLYFWRIGIVFFLLFDNRHMKEKWKGIEC